MKFEYHIPNACSDLVSRHGDRVTIDLQGLNASDEIMRGIERHRTFYEHDLLYHLACRELWGGVYIDVGANIGNHAVYFGKFLAEHVVCVEPYAALHSVLRRNLEVNGVHNYTLVVQAIGSTAGTGYLVLADKDQGNIGMARVGKQAMSNEPEQVVHQVEIRTLDKIVAEQKEAWGGKSLKLVKIDVEGLQLDVLRGATDVLNLYRPQLVIEAATYKEQKSIHAFLDSEGYVSVGRFCATPTFHFIDPSVHQLKQAPLEYWLKRSAARIRRQAGAWKWKMMGRK